MRSIVLWTLLAVMLPVSLAAKDTGIAVDPLSSLDGLISNHINDLYIDSLGVMWVAGQGGLSRFDGYEFMNFSTGVCSEDITSNNIKKIYPAFDNEIWILTEKGEIAFFNTVDFSPVAKRKDSVKDLKINSVAFSGKERVFLGTTSGLYECGYDLGNIRKIHYRDRIDGKNDNAVRAVYVDSDENIWIGTWADGIYIIPSGYDDVIRLSFPRVRSIKVNGFMERTNKMYIMTWGQGLVELPTPIDKDNIGARYVKSAEHDWDIIFSACCDRSGNIWLGTAKGIRILKSDGREVLYSRFYRDGDLYNINEVFGMTMDSSGTVWITLSNNGIGAADIRTNYFSYDNLSSACINSNYVDAVFLDKSTGYLWLGVRGVGLVVYDYIHARDVSHEYGKYVESINRRANSIRNFWESADKSKLYMATRYDGIYILSKKEGVITGISHIKDASRVETRCAHMAVDSQGNIYMSTIGDDVYFIRYNKDDDTFECRLSKDIKDVIGENCISCMLVDSEDNLWIGTELNGAIRVSFDPVSTKPVSVDHVHDSDNDEIYVLYQDPAGRIWAGTNGGISLYDGRKNFDKADFLRTDRVGQIMQITEDDTGGMWISGNSQWIIRYSPTSGQQINSYYVDEKISFSNNAVANNGDAIIMGSNAGILSFDVSGMPTKSEAIRPFVSDISIYNKSLAAHGRDDLIRISDGMMPPYTSRITLDYNENSINLKFSAVPFHDNDKYDYAYMLEGVDNDWQYTLKDQHAVTYSKLPSGKYSFTLKVSNGSGNWSQAMSLEVIVKKAPWRTTGAIVSYSCVAIVLVLTLAYFIVKDTKEKHLKELENLDKSKEKDVYNAKLAFFTNIISNESDKIFFERFVNYVKTNLENAEYDNASLCKAMAMSYSTLYRKVKNITGMSPQELTRSIKLKIACTMLLDKNNNVSDVAYSLGYSEAKYFSACFKKEFGMSPRDYIKSRQNEK